MQVQAILYVEIGKKYNQLYDASATEMAVLIAVFQKYMYQESYFMPSCKEKQVASKQTRKHMQMKKHSSQDLNN